MARRPRPADDDRSVRPVRRGVPGRRAGPGFRLPPAERPRDRAGSVCDPVVLTLPAAAPRFGIPPAGTWAMNPSRKRRPAPPPGGGAVRPAEVIELTGSRTDLPAITL